MGILSPNIARRNMTGGDAPQLISQNNKSLQLSTNKAHDKIRKIKEFSRQFKNNYRPPPNLDMISVVAEPKTKWQIISQTRNEGSPFIP